MSAEQKIARLEHHAYQLLETPTETTETVSYNLTLSDEYSLRLESTARNEAAAHIGEIWEQPQMETRVFIGHRGPLQRRRQRNAMAFSCLIEQHPEAPLRGMQYDAPHELPEPMDTADLFVRPIQEIKDNIFMFGMGDAQRSLYVATQGLMRYVDQLSANPHKYTQPPVNNEAAADCDDEMADAYSEWCDWHTFELPLDMQHTAVSGFVRAANILLAEGTIHRHTNFSKNTPRYSIEIDANSYTNLARHYQPHRDPPLHVSIVKDGLEHTYLQPTSGPAEIRVRPGDYIERYCGLESFTSTRDAEGTVTSFTYDEQEYRQLVQAERALGLFKPTDEEIDFFIEHLQQLG